MKVVIDTVVVQHLLRQPRKKRRKKLLARFETVLDPYVKCNRLIICVDAGNGLTSEWVQTCGAESIHVLITHWDSFNGMELVKKIKPLSLPFARRLRQLGFTDTIDKLILRIALSLPDRTVVSNDSDFWHPLRPTNQRARRDRNSPIARLCREEACITVMSLKDLLSTLH